MAFVTIATVPEVPPGKAKQVAINDRLTLALFNVEGTFYAIDNICPHQRAPLAEGDLAGRQVLCPWHGAPLTWPAAPTSAPLPGEE